MKKKITKLDTKPKIFTWGDSIALACPICKEDALTPVGVSSKYIPEFGAGIAFECSKCNNKVSLFVDAIDWEREDKGTSGRGTIATWDYTAEYPEAHQDYAETAIDDNPVLD